MFRKLMRESWIAYRAAFLWPAVGGLFMVVSLSIVRHLLAE